MPARYATKEELLATDPQLEAELKTFSPKALDYCLATYEVLLEEGVPQPQAVRDAVAVILQHKRLVVPTLTNNQLKEALRLEKEYLLTMTPEDADKAAFARALKGPK